MSVKAMSVTFFLILFLGVTQNQSNAESTLDHVSDFELTVEQDIRRYEEFMALRQFIPELEWPKIPEDFDLSKANETLSGLEIYKNWCGAGHYPKNPDGSVNRDYPAANELDAVCKRHDLCYFDNCDHWCPCDATLLKEVSRATCPDEECETYRIAMIAVFVSKPSIVCYKKSRWGQTVKWSQNGIGGNCPNVISRCPNGCPHIK